MIRSFLILLAATVANISYAKEGEPIAVRIWPDDVVSIENQWNLKLAIHRGDDASIPSIAECDKSVGLAETLRHALVARTKSAEAELDARRPMQR